MLVVSATTVCFSQHSLSDSPLIILVVLGILVGFWAVWVAVCVVIAAIKARNADDFDPFSVFLDSVLMAWLVIIAAALVFAICFIVYRLLLS